MQRGRSYTATDLEDAAAAAVASVEAAAAGGKPQGDAMEVDSPPYTMSRAAGGNPPSKQAPRFSTPVRDSIPEEVTEVALPQASSKSTSLTPLFRRTFSGFDMEDSYAKRSAFLAPRDAGSPEPRLTADQAPLPHLLQAGFGDADTGPRGLIKGSSTGSPARKSRRLASGIKLME